jgi:hypothetical protein
MLLAPLRLSYSITSRKVGVAHFSMLSVLGRAKEILAQERENCKAAVKGIIAEANGRRENRQGAKSAKEQGSKSANWQMSK